MFYILGGIGSVGLHKTYAYKLRGKDRGYYTWLDGSLEEGPFPEKYMRQTIIMDAHGDPKVYMPILERVYNFSSALSKSYT